MKKSLFWYALGHFSVDLVCAWLLLGSLPGERQWPMLALAYNFCAFALQMPLGAVADRVGRNRPFSALGAVVVCAAALPLLPWPRVLLAGTGNALYHVGGGRETLLHDRRYGPLGIFVAPGAVGLFLGGLFRDTLWAGLVGVALLALCGLRLGLLARRENPTPTALQRVSGRAIAGTAALFLVVALRSLVGMCLNSPWKTGVWAVFGVLLAAMGKAVGGIAADRFRGGVTGCVSLLLAAALFCLPESPVAGILAGFLFNMSMPITLRGAAECLPGGPGFSFGLLTFALFLGFLPALEGFTLPPTCGAILAGASGLILGGVVNELCSTSSPCS